MTFFQLTFYFFAAVAVLAAIAVVTIKNPVKAALFLVLAFVASAGVWMTAQAEFLAIVLVLVYVGAVMVLFLFVVMMLDIDLAAMRAGFTRYLPFGALVALVLMVELALVMTGAFDAGRFPQPAELEPGYSNTKALGAVLYTEYVFAFEVAALILLVAMVAAIALTHRPGERPVNRSVDPAKQVRVVKADRLKLVDLPKEGQD